MHGRQSASPAERRDRSLLAGTVVIEMASVISGPCAGGILADLGADVIKIEPPGGGDPFRSWEADADGVRPSFAAYNRGKRSIVLDIKSAAGRHVFRRLVERADVVIENYRPGRMERLGIGSPQLLELNPRLVYCHVTGRGSSGPDAERPTYDAVAQALSGVWSQLTDLGAPVPVGPTIADQLTGIYASIAVLAALQRRHRSGSGGLVEVDMLSAGLAFSAAGIAATTRQGRVPTMTSRARNSQSYAFVSADGLPLAVHLSTPHKFWVALCTTVGAPELIEDERFRTKKLRIAHYDELHETLAAIFATRTRDEWVADLVAHDVPVAPILTLAEAIEQPQVLHQGAVARGGPERKRGLVRSPVVVHGHHCEAELPPPELGEHTDALLEDFGVDPLEIAELRENGVVA